MPDQLEHSCFGLQLANSQSWNIFFNHDTSEWITEFAEILSLKKRPPGSGIPSIYFYQSSRTILNTSNNSVKKPVNRDYLSDENWSNLDFGSLIIRSRDHYQEVVCEIVRELSFKERIINMWNSLLPIYQRVIDSGGIPLHAALIEKDGAGVLLAAPGGSGKSTCCRRLPSPWNVLSDDETLLVLDESGEFIAHPFPTWSNHILNREPRTWKVESHVPVRAIFFLEQAEEDRINPLGQGNSAVLINQSATQVCRRAWFRMEASDQRAGKEQLFVRAGNLARRIPAFSLKVSLDGRFWELIDRVLVNLVEAG